MNQPLVTVLLTAYNAEAFLAEALESIIQQTYPNMEILLVDDGSTDSSLAIMQEFQARDSRIRIDQHENMGITKSSNRALQMAQGDIIVRLDADDIMVPNRVEEQVKFLLENPEVTMVSSDCLVINDEGKTVGTQIMPGYDTIAHSRKMATAHNTVVAAHTAFAAYKKNILDVGGYNESIRCVVDQELFTRMVEQGNNLIILRKFLVKYRIYRGSVVGKNSKNFLLQRTESFVRECMMCRRLGKPEPSYDDFMESLEKQPFLKKMQRYRKYYAHYYYRSALQYIGMKDYPRIVYSVFLAIFFAPYGMSRKIYRQIKRKYAAS